MMILAALPGAMQALRCDLVTTYEGKTKRSIRQVTLASNSWREAEAGQMLTELCAAAGRDGYHCKLGVALFVATSNEAGLDSSTVRINLRNGAYLDQGYMDGKVITTHGLCKRR
jgi:hypothetical protein